MIQVDINADRIGLTKPVSVAIQGDARLVAEQLLAALGPAAGDAGRAEREALVAPDALGLAAAALVDGPRGRRSGHDLERAGAGGASRSGCRPRMAWRAIQAALPKEAIISSDIGNNCAIGNAYPSFEEGRKYLAPGLFGPCGYGFPAILGAKIGCPEVPVVGFAGDGAFGIAVNELTACGREEWPAMTWWCSATTSGGRRSGTRRSGSTTISSGPSSIRRRLCGDRAGLRAEGGAGDDDGGADRGAAREAVEAQMERGETTLIEVILNQELGEPFRRDAMKKPVRVAGIRREDMRAQALTAGVTSANLS